MTKNILLAEDEVFIKDMYLKVLSDHGYHVDTVEDGQQALDKIFNPDNNYDLIILDIMMPKVDGISVLKQIKAETSSSKNTPVFLLTNLGLDHVIAEAVSLGADKYFIKADLIPKKIADEVDKF